MCGIMGYIGQKILVPMVMAAIWSRLSRPTMAISTMPSRGTVILVMIFGIVSCRIFLFINRLLYFLQRY